MHFIDFEFRLKRCRFNSWVLTKSAYWMMTLYYYYNQHNKSSLTPETFLVHNFVQRRTVSCKELLRKRKSEDQQLDSNANQWVNLRVFPSLLQSGLRWQSYSGSYSRFWKKYWIYGSFINGGTRFSSTSMEESVPSLKYIFFFSGVSWWDH